MEELWLKVVGFGIVWTIAIAIVAYFIYRVFQ